MKHKMVIVGFGGMGKWHYDNIAGRIPQIEVTGVIDTDPSKTREALEAGLKVYASAEDVIKVGEADIALIATPNCFHKQYAVDFLLGGLNVVCEKPVCMNTAELEEILSARAKTDKMFTVHHNRRWDMDFQIAKRIINERLIGKPYYIDSRLYGCKGLPGDWRADMSAGGGMLYDWSVHLIDQMLQLTGCAPESVYADLKKIRYKGVDDCNRLLLNFPGGLTGEITVDSWCYINEPRWHISADDGTAIIDNWFGKSGKIVKANIKEIDWEKGVIVTPNGRTRTLSPRPQEHLTEWELPLPPDADTRWEAFYENVVAVIEGRGEQIVKIEEIIITTKIIDACFESARKGQTVKL